MIAYFVLFIILFYFIIASIEDIKKREVYDYINFSLSFLILAIAIFHSFLIESFDPIKYVAFGFLIGFALGSFLYYIGIWGGGDAKFLIGFSSASYYLLNFINLGNSQISSTFNKIIELLSIFFTMFLDTFFSFVLILDFGFLVIILISYLFFIKNNEDKKNAIQLFYILFLMFLGLYLKLENSILVLFAFISFVMIFFSRDNLFQSIYFKIKKPILSLVENDKIDSNIIYKKKKIVDYKNSKFGLTKQDISNIYENVDKNYQIKIKKIFPLSSLITINFIIYILSIISLDVQNLNILSFLFEFLFNSFIAGGIIVIAIIIYYYFKNFKKIKITFSKLERILIISFSSLFLILSIINIKFSLLFLIIILYYFLKISKEVEKFIFVSKKDLEKIVPGDWIVQDIKIKNKLIYSISDFKLGIDEIQLSNLKNLAKENKSLNKIFVKDGIAFLPPLFIGFLIILLF